MSENNVNSTEEIVLSVEMGDAVSAQTAEAYAVGKRGGVDVAETDPTWHNNAKYYAEQAEEAAGEAQGAEEAAQRAEAAQAAAEAARDRAEAIGAGAAQSAAAAAESAQAAATAKTGAETAQSAAAGSATAAEGSAGRASQSATAAAGSATAAGTAKTAAETARDAAAGSATAAAGSATAADQSAQAAAASAQAAEDVAESIPADYSQLSDDVSGLKSALSNETIRTTGVVLSDAAGWERYNSSFDGLEKNRIYFVAYTNGISLVPYSGFVGSVLTYNYTFTGAAQTQLAISRNGDRMMVRVCQAGTWYPWREYNPTNEIKTELMTLIDTIQQNVDLVSGKLESYFIPGKNLINLSDTKNIRESAYVSDSGNVNNLSSWNCIAVKIDPSKERLSVNKPNSYLVFLSDYTNGSLSTVEIPGHLDGFISAVVGTGTDFTKSDNVEIPSNASWVVVSNSKTNFASLQLEYGPVHTSYTPYKIALSSEIVLPGPVEVNVTDYSNLRVCLESVTPSKNCPVIVNIPAGTYDIKAMFTSEERSEASFRGLFVPDYVTLHGIDSRENTILTYSSDVAEDKISTLNIYNVASLENLTVEASNIRYCVHDDYATAYDGENIRNVKNCIFRKIVNGGYACAYGAGMKGNAQWMFENCDFIGDGATFRGFSIHNNTPVAKDSNITLKNCRFRNSVVSSQEIRVDSFNSNVTGLTYLYLIGCGFNNASKITLTESSASSYGSGIKAKVSGYGNTFGNSDVTITVTDGVDYSGNVDLI